MVRLSREPIAQRDPEEYLSTTSDFAFELRTLKLLRAQGQLYTSARAWRAPIRSRSPELVKRNPFTLPVKLDRRPGDAKRGLARLSKSHLIEQLLELQNAYAVVRAGWLKANGPKSSARSRPKIELTLNKK
jgi:hypothetical protein